MPPVIALVLCFVFTAYLLRGDISRRTGVSNALWIPLLWTTIIGSRLVSQWLGSGNYSGSLEEGNAVDAAYFSLLMLAGIVVLHRRNVGIVRVACENPWVALFFLYAALSILWSDFPFVAMKRWVKEVGILVMILVVLSETEPLEAATALIRRCAFILIPLSVVLVKYYPQLGKQFSDYSGEAFFVGVATSKNMLGNLCLVTGLFFSWSIFKGLRQKKEPLDKFEILVHAAFLGMIVWLLNLASSATSLLCLTIGIGIVVGFEFPILKRNPTIGANAIVICVALGALLEGMFGVSEWLIPSLGRDTTLTGRSEIWDEVLAMGTNPLLGTGFESFWLGERLDQMWARHWWKPTGSHNGYLETYINLGWIGVILLCLLLISVFRKIKEDLKINYDYGRFELALFWVALVYNFTEAAFKGTIIVWFIFLLVAVRAPSRSEKKVYAGSETAEHLTVRGPIPHQSP